MPELPEVETIRLQLEQRLEGLTIIGFEILNKKSFLGNPEKVKGLKVLGAKRRAKVILLELEKGVFLAIHLKLTGQLIYREGEDQGERTKKVCEEKDGVFSVCELPNKFTRVIISFDNGGRLYFNDLRMFGWIKVVESSNFKVEGAQKVLELSKLGPEANDEKTFTFDYFKRILSKTKKPIKLVIIDQEKLAGVGNIYANEALFMAGIRPTRPANSLTEEEIKKLRESIIKVLNEAIAHKGTSDKDEAYRQISGEKGEYQNYLKVYGKEGKPCPSCHSKIKKIRLGGRGTFYCPNCQK